MTDAADRPFNDIPMCRDLSGLTISDIDTPDMGCLNDTVEEYAERIVAERERKIILAFHNDFDGVDIYDGGVDFEPGEFGHLKIRSAILPWWDWEPKKPERPDWAIGMGERLVFEDVTYQDIRDVHKEQNND